MSQNTPLQPQPPQGHPPQGHPPPQGYQPYPSPQLTFQSPPPVSALSQRILPQFSQHQLPSFPSTPFIRVWTGSWNMGAKDPLPHTVDELPLFIPGNYDLYVLAVQEGKSNAFFEVVATYLSKFGVVKLPASAQVHGRGDGSFVGTKFTGVTVYCRAALAPFVNVLASADLSLGLTEGSKGGAGVALMLLGTTMCFISVHLPANNPEKRLEAVDYILKTMAKKMLDLDDTQLHGLFHHLFILGDMNFRLNNVSDSECLRAISDQGIMNNENRQVHHDIKYSNYTPTHTHTHTQGNFGLKYLLSRDELTLARQAGLFVGFQEPSMCPFFFPSYKRKETRSVTDWADSLSVSQSYKTRYKEPWYKSGKVSTRVPAFTDRVLYLSQGGLRCETWVEYYTELNKQLRADGTLSGEVKGSIVTSIEKQSQDGVNTNNYFSPNCSNYCVVNDAMTLSDHAPVYATFIMDLPHIDVRPYFPNDGSVAPAVTTDNSKPKLPEKPSKLRQALADTEREGKEEPVPGINTDKTNPNQILSRASSTSPATGAELLSAPVLSTQLSLSSLTLNTQPQSPNTHLLSQLTAQGPLSLCVRVHSVRLIKPVTKTVNSDLSPLAPSSSGNGLLLVEIPVSTVSVIFPCPFEHVNSLPHSPDQLYSAVKHSESQYCPSLALSLSDVHSSHSMGDYVRVAQSAHTPAHGHSHTHTTSTVTGGVTAGSPVGLEETTDLSDFLNDSVITDPSPTDRPDPSRKTNTVRLPALRSQWGPDLTTTTSVMNSENYSNVMGAMLIPPVDLHPHDAHKHLHKLTVKNPFYLPFVGLVVKVRSGPLSGQAVFRITMGEFLEHNRPREVVAPLVSNGRLVVINSIPIMLRLSVETFFIVQAPLPVASPTNIISPAIA